MKVRSVARMRIAEVAAALVSLSACGTDVDSSPAPAHDAALLESSLDATHSDGDAAEPQQEASPEDSDMTDVQDGPQPADSPDAPVLPAHCQAAAELPSWLEAPAGGSALVAHTAMMDLHIEALDHGPVRLRYVAKGAGLPVERGWAVPAAAALDPEAVVTGTSLGAQLCTRWLSVLVQPDGRLQVLDESSAVLVEDPAGGGWSEQVGDAGEATIARVVRATPADELFYGFGERTGALERRGTRMVFWNTDSYQSAYGGWAPGTDPLYQSIPFFLGMRSARAYGVFTNNSYRVEMDMAHSNSAHYEIAAHGGTLEQYVIPGPSMEAVLGRYARLTGAPAMPPRWALGYHQSRWGYSPASKLEQLGQEFRSRKLPADGLWLDIQHMDGFRTFTWDPVAFPAPSVLIGQLESQGFKVITIADPGIKQELGWDVYDSGVAGGHFLRRPDQELYVGAVWPGASVFPDFTSFSARLWWGQQVGGELARGVRGIWLDVNEPTVFPESGGGSIPGDVPVQGDGAATTMAEAHNVYALQEARATWEGMKQHAPGRRPFILTRAGFAGIQRYAAVWTGDAPSSWESLQQTLPMLLNLGLSGVPLVGSDVGGYSGHATPELFARWMQLGSISPFFRGHVTNGVPDQEPWAFGQEVEDISRAMIEQRYELLPYLYSLLAEASRTGAPVLRPLVYEFQAEPSLRAIDDEAMVGPFLLAAPIDEQGAVERVVRLPAGRWYELHSGAIYDGPATLKSPITLAALPLYVREGAIIPRAQPMLWSNQHPIDPLVLDVYPGEQESAFVFYEDQGDGFDYEQGVYSRVTYTTQKTATGARLTASPREGTFAPPSRGVRVRLRRVDHMPTAVALGGVSIPKHMDESSLSAAGTGWWYDERDLSLVIMYPEQNGFELEATYDGSIGEPRPPVVVEFEVSVPAGTPTSTQVHVATSAGAWAHVPLSWTGTPELARGQVSLPRGEWFWFKYTRGDWNTVEKWPGCEEATNRYGFGAAHPMRKDSVFTWRDWCP